MHARDASGRRVSLLNDDSPSYPDRQRPIHRPVGINISQQFSAPVMMRSVSSSPNTPGLMRSNSYDSQMSTESISPLTPIYDYSRAYIAAHDMPMSHDYMSEPHRFAAGGRRPSNLSNSRSSSYEGDPASPAATRHLSDRSAKRYPCRYRDSHGCEKTFTTSGHASRHSKIHTAEKAVPCTHRGCTKKFTRADNMKQHLETHYKEKSRTMRPVLSSTDRRFSSGRVSTSSRKAAAATVPTHSPLPSPRDAWDMSGLNVPLMRPQSVSRTPSAGLDALAMAVACQQEEDS